MLFQSIVILICVASLVAKEGYSQINEFTAGPGDVLRIKLYYPETAEEVVVVSPDYRISYSYLGTIPVKGMTLDRIQKTIKERLADGYLKYPVVTVSIEQIRSKKIFVFGEVVNPSVYPWTPDLTILSAIALAGGFARYSTFQIQVFREGNDSANFKRINMSVSSLLSENPGKDIKVFPGDVIVISDKTL